MNSKKTFFIGFVIPFLAIVLVCVVTYFQNSHSMVKNLVMRAPEESMADENTTEVPITAENWDEYFSLETELVLHKNEDGELERVQYVDKLSLKEEYRDKIEMEKKNWVTLAGMCPTESMTYEITDAKAAEWNITGELNVLVERNGKNIRKSFIWNTEYWDTADDYSVEYGYDSAEYMGQELMLERPVEFRIETVDGALYFMK